MKNQTHNSIKPDNPGLAKGVKRGLIAVAALALIAAVYAGYWNYLAGQVRAGIEQWAADRRAEGHGAEYAAVAVGGFPFRLVAEISAPALVLAGAAPGPARPWSWRGPSLIIEARPWALAKVRVLAPGRHRVTAMAGGKRRQYDIEAGALTATLDFTPGPVALTIALDASDIVYPREPVAGLGRTTKRLTLTIEVKGDLPPEIEAAAMARWRDSGGTLDVSRLDIRHGPLELTGDGTGALDADMQPIGAFTLSVRGFNEALDRLEAAGIIKPNPAALVKTVLNKLARAPAAESAAEPDTEAGPDSKPEL
ncbi:MAG: DUF2125 domain-containing protein, partial [Rhodospirillales bacterium]